MLDPSLVLDQWKIWFKILLQQVNCVAGTVRADTASFLSCTVVVLHYF